MPTLIRLVVILLVLVGLGYGAMFALVMFVTPNEKEVTLRIPARDLVPSPQRDPLVLREINTSRPVEPAPAAAPAAEPAAAAESPGAAGTAETPPAAAPQGGEDGEVVTLAPGIE
jgi:hypothetical protein